MYHLVFTLVRTSTLGGGSDLTGWDNIVTTIAEMHWILNHFENSIAIELTKDSRYILSNACY